MPATRPSRSRLHTLALEVVQTDSGVGPSAHNSQSLDLNNHTKPTELEPLLDYQLPPAPSQPSPSQPSPRRSQPTTRPHRHRPLRQHPYSRFPDPRPAPLELSDLELIRILGAGAFGQVSVVRVQHREEHCSLMERPGALFAMKAFRKSMIRKSEKASDIPEQKEDKSVERKHLVNLPWHPFIAGLVDTFIDERNLYQAMELGHCGSLSALMRKRGAIPSADTRFYFANIVLALEFIHSHGIVHRDLKPENILVGSDGYLMLGDFGCAAHQTSKGNWEGVGTTMYMPPECLRFNLNPKIRSSLDWWAAGVILYEMASGLLGSSDREAQDTKAMTYQILSGAFEYPPEMKVDPRLKHLIRKMLHSEDHKRLGAIMPYRNGVYMENDEIRRHPFMLGVQWERMSERRILAPYVPKPPPNLIESWQARGMPRQRQIPGLLRGAPLAHIAWDNRIRWKASRAFLRQIIPRS